MKGLVPSTVVLLLIAIVVMIGLISLFIYYGFGSFKSLEICDPIRKGICCDLPEGEKRDKCFENFQCRPDGCESEEGTTTTTSTTTTTIEGTTTTAIPECEVSDKPIVANPSVVDPGESTTVSIWEISSCIGRKAVVYLENGGSTNKCGEKTVDSGVFDISCSVPSTWSEGISKVWIWVDEDDDDEEESGEYTDKLDITISSVIEECFYGTLECGSACHDHLGHNEYEIGCYKFGCPPGWESIGDYGCSGLDSECTHCCCHDLS